MRPEKTSILADIKELLEDGDYTIVADYKGLTVEQMSELRTQLREVNSGFRVVKCSMTELAARELGREVQAGGLSGAIGMASGKGDVSVTAKILRDFGKKGKAPLLMGGWLGSRPMGADDVSAIADLPPREILLGMVVGTICAPMTQLVGVMQQKLASLVYVLKAVQEKKGTGE